ncbi:MAG: hypothetical protein ABIJ58_03010 [Nanoarchaeota archaeon]
MTYVIPDLLIKEVHFVHDCWLKLAFGQSFHVNKIIAEKSDSVDFVAKIEQLVAN